MVSPQHRAVLSPRAEEHTRSPDTSSSDVEGSRSKESDQASPGGSKVVPPRHWAVPEGCVRRRKQVTERELDVVSPQHRAVLSPRAEEHTKSPDDP